MSALAAMVAVVKYASILRDHFDVSATVDLHFRVMVKHVWTEMNVFSECTVATNSALIQLVSSYVAVTLVSNLTLIKEVAQVIISALKNNTIPA